MKYVFIILLISNTFSNDIENLYYYLQTVIDPRIEWGFDEDLSEYYTLDQDSNIIELKLNNLHERLFTYITRLGSAESYFPHLLAMNFQDNPEMEPVVPVEMTLFDKPIINFSFRNSPTCDISRPGYRDDLLEYTEMGFGFFCDDYISLGSLIDLDSLDSLLSLDTNGVSIKAHGANPATIPLPYLNGYNAKGIKIDLYKE